MRLVTFDPRIRRSISLRLRLKRSAVKGRGVYFVGGRLNLSWLHKQIGGLPADSHWKRRCRAALRRVLAAKRAYQPVKKLGPPARVATLINEWKRKTRAFDRSRQRCRICDPPAT
jgi:NAD-specific glutamate dehydrogenase